MKTPYITGTLVAVGQPDEGRPPRAEVITTEDLLRRVATLPMHEPVAIVPVADLEESAQPVGFRLTIDAVGLRQSDAAAQAENNRLTTARALDVYRLLTRAEKGEAELAQLRADKETLRRLLNLAETVPYAERSATEQAAINAARKEGAK